MALGAGPSRIRSMVMRELSWILGIVLVAGIPAALALSKLTESQLYGVKSYDALVVAIAAMALTVTAIAAGYLPAPRLPREPSRRPAPRVTLATPWRRHSCRGALRLRRDSSRPILRVPQAPV